VLALGWRDPRFALVFAAGPLLAPVGLLALVPLAVQPARGVVRRFAQAALALVAAAVVAASAGDELPLAAAPAQPLHLAPQDSVGETGARVWDAATLDPTLVLGALALGLAAAILPWARGRSRYGVLAVGAVLLAGAVTTGVGFAAVLLVALVWAFAGAVAAGAPRRATV
jgi:hypothetical protein